MPKGLTPYQEKALAIIREHGPIELGDFRERMKPACIRTCFDVTVRLEELGLIKRTTSLRNVSSKWFVALDPSTASSPLGQPGRSTP